MPALAARGGLNIRVYGAGPAGLAAAEVLAAGGVQVTVVDRMPSPARKFLMAGRGGLNLTHSEPIDVFLSRYGAARERLEPAIRSYPPSALRAWADELNAETFVGSSGRIFPKAMKASPLLRIWLRRLESLGVRFQFREAWNGFDGAPCVLALGGASWPRLGGDGSWVKAFTGAGIRILPLTAANSGVRIPWSARIIERFSGAPLKRIRVSVAGVVRMGEAVITRSGLEGGVIYGLAPALRNHPGEPLRIDFLPGLDETTVQRKLAAARAKDSRANRLRKAFSLPPQAIAVISEGGGDPKCTQLTHQGLAGLDRAISSAGGVAFDEIDDRYMLVKKPGTFVCGEMLDWEAPTGGYLLQACFATGRAAGAGLLAWLAQRRP